MAIEYNDYGQIRHAIYDPTKYNSKNSTTLTLQNTIAKNIYSLYDLAYDTDTNYDINVTNNYNIIPSSKYPANYRYATIEDIVAFFAWDYLYYNLNTAVDSEGNLRTILDDDGSYVLDEDAKDYCPTKKEILDGLTVNINGFSVTFNGDILPTLGVNNSTYNTVYSTDEDDAELPIYDDFMPVLLCDIYINSSTPSIAKQPMSIYINKSLYHFENYGQEKDVFFANNIVVNTVYTTVLTEDNTINEVVQDNYENEISPAGNAVFSINTSDYIIYKNIVSDFTFSVYWQVYKKITNENDGTTNSARIYLYIYTITSTYSENALGQKVSLYRNSVYEYIKNYVPITYYDLVENNDLSFCINSVKGTNVDLSNKTSSDIRLSDGDNYLYSSGSSIKIAPETYSAVDIASFKLYDNDTEALTEKYSILTLFYISNSEYKDIIALNADNYNLLVNSATNMLSDGTLQDFTITPDSTYTSTTFTKANPGYIVAFVANYTATPMIINFIPSFVGTAYLLNGIYTCKINNYLKDNVETTLNENIGESFLTYTKDYGNVVGTKNFELSTIKLKKQPDSKIELTLLFNSTSEDEPIEEKTPGYINESKTVITSLSKSTNSSASSCVFIFKYVDDVTDPDSTTASTSDYSISGITTNGSSLSSIPNDKFTISVSNNMINVECINYLKTLSALSNTVAIKIAHKNVHYLTLNITYSTTYIGMFVTFNSDETKKLESISETTLFLFTTLSNTESGTEFMNDYDTYYDNTLANYSITDITLSPDNALKDTIISNISLTTNYALRGKKWIAVQGYATTDVINLISKDTTFTGNILYSKNGNTKIIPWTGTVLAASEYTIKFYAAYNSGSYSGIAILHYSSTYKTGTCTENSVGTSKDDPMTAEIPMGQSGATCYIEFTGQGTGKYYVNTNGSYASWSTSGYTTSGTFSSGGFTTNKFSIEENNAYITLYMVLN